MVNGSGAPRQARTESCEPTAARVEKSEETSHAACILLIEDNPGDALLIEAALAEHRVPADLLVLNDGEKAIQCVEEFEKNTGPYPGLVILDLNLPKLTGIAVLGRIRRSVHWNQVPVVILTSSNSPNDRSEATRLGADLYLQKPVALDAFLEIGTVIKSFLVQ